MRNQATHPSRRNFLGLTGAAMFLPGAGKAAPLATISGEAFGTTWQLTAASGVGLDYLGTAIEAVFGDIDSLMSPYRRDSALSRFNAAPAGWHAAAPEMTHVVRAALEVAKLTLGAFDPTVGPLVARWGFGPIKGGAPGWRDLAIGTESIFKPRPDLTLDLCGIAKGWALDRAVALAQASGVTDMLFDLGGELRAVGHHPSGRLWRVAIEDPGTSLGAAVLELPPGLAVATSGLRSQGYDLAGRIYGHIIDPVTGQPADGTLNSVSVVAPAAMTADAWATALFAAGPKTGPALARQQGVAAMFLVEDEVGLWQVRTGAIDDLLT